MSTPVYEEVQYMDVVSAYPEGLVTEDYEEDLSKKAHIVTPADNLGIYEVLSAYLGRAISAKDMVDIARKAGQELVALCQYRWVPTEIVGNHDTCMACLAIAQQRMSEGE